MEGFSGVYGDLTQGEVEAMQMAIDDFGGKVLGRPIEILQADHQTKPDVGAAIARKWYDVDGVKMITGIGTSSVALAVRKIAQEKGMIDINTGAASADLTGPSCSETGAHWVYDTYSLAKVTGGAVVKDGGDSWYFLTADYAFGHALERDVTAVVQAAGGKVLGGVRHPLSTQDFSSFLLQAQASKAKVIGLANAGQDTINSIKQAGEFGITKGGQRLAGLLVFSTDVAALTLPVAQGLVLTEVVLLGSQRRDPRLDQALPRQEGQDPQHARRSASTARPCTISKAVQAAGTDEAKAVMAKMREIPVNDVMTKNGKLREDGRLERDMYLFQVKTPAESKSKDDIYKLIATVPGNEAYRPMKDGKCPFVKG